MKVFRIIAAIVAVAAAAFVVYHFHERRATARLNNEAKLLLDQNRYAEACAKLELARRKDSQNHVIWKNLGIAYEGLGRLAKAVDAYERSLAIAPNQPDVRRNLEMLKRELEVERKKIVALEEELQRRPGDARVLAEIGKVYERIGEKERAAEYYQRSLKADPAQPDLQKRLEALRQGGLR